MIPDRIEFTKMTAGGNDFICLDNSERAFSELINSEHWPGFVRSLCRRGLSIGADGVIVACERGSAGGIDIIARFLEPDGSEADLCGNGTACFTYWIVGKGLVDGPEVTILTAAGMARGRIADEEQGRVVVCVPDPRDLRMGLELNVKGETWQLDYLQTGVPHAVTFVDSLEHLDVDHWGPGIRYHSHFQPHGVNANFVKVLTEGHIAVRTYEFGVEDETLACGTGSVASAIITCLRYGWPRKYGTAEEPVLVDVRGGETLRIWFVCHDDGRITDVCLETRARAVYDGTFRPEFTGELRELIDKAAAEQAEA